jgi:hypothetical protein
MFYIYEIIVDGIRRYIGKGKGSRGRDHLQVVRRIVKARANGQRIRATRFYNKLAKAWLGGAEITTAIIVDNLCESEAYEREVSEIAASTDLWNHHPGGRGMTSEFAKYLWANDKNADRRRDQLRNIQPPADIKRIGTANYWADEQTRIKESERRKQLWLSPEYRIKATPRKGEKKPVGFGAKVAQRNRDRWADETNREAQSSALKLALSNPSILEKRTKARWTRQARLAQSERSRATSIFCNMDHEIHAQMARRGWITRRQRTATKETPDAV